MTDTQKNIGLGIAGVFVGLLFLMVTNGIPSNSVPTTVQQEKSSVDKLIDVMMIQMISDMANKTEDISLGGVYSNVIKDFSEGISVDGTTVIDGSGNIDAPITSTTGTFSSTLGVTGATTLSSTLGVTGATTLSSTLGVTGTSTLATTTATKITVSGAGIFSSTLAVTGATTLSSTLGVTGTSTLATTTVTNLTVTEIDINDEAVTFGTVASSTVQVGAASKAGCIILGDSADGANPVYITATGETITASTTQPAACRAVQ